LGKSEKELETAGVERDEEDEEEEDKAEDDNDEEEEKADSEVCDTGEEEGGEK
jgi:hypothetical protein